MQYVSPTDGVPKNCPVPGTWKLIETGRFLRSVGDDNDNRGKPGGSADAIIPKHTHNVHSTGRSLITVTGGAHGHQIKKKGTAHDGSNDDTFRTAQSDKLGEKEITWTVEDSGDHTHGISISGLNATTPEGSQDVTNANLPPYLNVYMWRRTA